MFGWIAASWGLFFILFIATNPGVCGEQRAGSSRCKRPDPTVGIYTCHGMTPVISEPHSPLCHLHHQIPRVAADNKAARDAAFCSRRSPSAGSAPNRCCLCRGAPMEINEVFSDLRFAETQLSVCRTIKLFPHVTMKLPKFAIWFSVSYAALWASSPPSPIVLLLSPHSEAQYCHRNIAFALSPLSGTFVFASPSNEINSITDFSKLAPEWHAYSFCYQFFLLPVISYLTIPLFHAGSRWVLAAQDIFLMKLATALKKSKSIISPGPCSRL